MRKLQECITYVTHILRNVTLYLFGSAGVEPFSGVEIHMEMDMEWKWSGNGAQFVKIVWIGLDFGPCVDLKPYDRYRTFAKHDISNTETRLYLIDWQICTKVEGLDANTANLF